MDFHLSFFGVGQDTDNPAIQLQGPFVNGALVPPPAHRTVVMIAAGTGINPSTFLLNDETIHAITTPNPIQYLLETLFNLGASSLPPVNKGVVVAGTDISTSGYVRANIRISSKASGCFHMVAFSEQSRRRCVWGTVRGSSLVVIHHRISTMPGQRAGLRAKGMQRGLY